jgi:GrpB-like predicted nucleotidyltransferase (UPF0157 family)
MTPNGSTPNATPRVYVTDYDPAWAQRYDTLRDMIWPAVCDIAQKIEHVGSTSVPQLAAKPIIDLDVIVTAHADIERCVQALTPLGYNHLGELGIQGRHALRHRSPLFAHNLYVCLDGSVGLRNHLTLRDHLRQHPTDALAYGALKKHLADQHPNDINAYVAGKTSFILSILARYPMTDAELKAIERANTSPP